MGSGVGTGYWVTTWHYQWALDSTGGRWALLVGNWVSLLCNCALLVGHWALLVGWVLLVRHWALLVATSNS
jgi:hypothetical protein